MSAWLAWTGAVVAAAWVALYLAHTLGGVPGLTPVLLHGRRAGLGLALGLAVVALTGLGGPVDGAALAGALVAGSAIGYAVLRQWAWPRPAAVLQPVTLADGSALVAVLPDGAAVRLADLARARTARAGDLLLVHCSLARSLAAFRAPPGPAPVAVLPHASGFAIGAGGRLWDGVDGRALDGDPDLARVPIRLCRAAAWRRQWPEGRLLGTGAKATSCAGRAGACPPPRHAGPAAATGASIDDQPRVLLPAARGLADPLRWGRVHAGAWHPLTDADLAAPAASAGPTCQHDATADPCYILSRWAARARGLPDRPAPPPTLPDPGCLPQDAA